MTHVTWGVDAQDNLWFYAEHPNDHPNPIKPPVTPEFWIHVDYAADKMKDLDVGRDGIVWGCTQGGATVLRTGVTTDEISGTAWVVKEGTCVNVAVCTSGNVWAVDT